MSDKLAETCFCEYEVVNPQCGCGNKNHRMRTYRDDIVHYRDGHWLVSCALEDSLTQLVEVTAERDHGTESLLATCVELDEYRERAEKAEAENDELRNTLDHLQKQIL